MNRWLREIRPIPIVLIAVGCLFVLKTIGLIFDGGYTLGQHLGSTGTLVVTTVPLSSTPQLRSPATALEMPSASGDSRRSWMGEMFNYPDVTGSVGAKPKEPAKDAPKEAAKDSAKDSAKDGDGAKAAQALPGAMPDGRSVPVEAARLPSAAERALLERLQEKRQALEERARELDMRESLVKAAEKKLETETAAQKAEEAKGGAGSAAQAADDARFKGVVTMYEAMKPKDAARIFDRLDSRVLLEVASHIKPQRMSEIMAQMSPENAERLTVELASRTSMDRGVNPANLPKIEGQPTAR
jgi:flagellar motility protein MotE (MotC chaperone)